MNHLFCARLQRKIVQPTTWIVSVHAGLQSASCSPFFPKRVDELLRSFDANAVAQGQEVSPVVDRDRAGPTGAQRSIGDRRIESSCD
jgi:hypothetical protein